MKPEWRYFLWIGATMVALATASAAGHAALVWKHARAGLERAHAGRIDAITERADALIAELQGELLEALAEVDATPAADRERRRFELFRLLRQERAFVRLVLLDTTGRVESQVDRLLPEGQDSAAELLDRIGGPAGELAGPSAVATFVYKDVQPRAVLVARRPVSAARTLAAEATLGSLDELLARIASGPGEYGYVVDRSGHVLAHSDPQNPRAAGVSLEGHGAAAAAASAAGAGRLLLQRVAKADGRSVVTSSADVAGLGGRVVVETDASIAFEPVRRSMYAGAAVLAVSLLAAVALSVIVARRIAQPIRRIEQAASRIGAGAYDLQVDPVAQRELSPLATALNTLAAQIGASHALLEQKVSERTAELARAKELAETADHAKTRFLAAASHDLRQPLHTVGILAALLLRRVRGGELHMLGTRLHAAVQALEDFFVGLLDLSRLEAGQVVVNREGVALGPLLVRLKERFEAIAGDGDNRVHVVGSRLAVDSDPVLLERMLQNLLGNALTHASAGRVLVGVRRHGANARIEVHDEGAGVRPEVREQIFEEFYRAPNRAAPPGLGLGLSIVRRFAQLLGHEVAVRDSPLGGACFSVEVPIVVAQDQAAAESSVAAAHAELENVFVLLVEDDPGALRWTERLLADSGCHVVAAMSAAAAETALAPHLRMPDVILSDYHFKGEDDGFGAVVALRDRLDTAIPIVLISGDLEALHQTQADACIAKPANPEELLAVLAAVASAPASATIR